MVTKPMSDLCWVCQSNSTAVMRAANLPVILHTVCMLLYLYRHFRRRRNTCYWQRRSDPTTGQCVRQPNRMFGSSFAKERHSPLLPHHRPHKLLSGLVLWASEATLPLHQSYLSDLERAVSVSADANVSQLNGRQCLPVIKQYRHICISADQPGCVCVKLESDSEDQHISLLNDHTWTPSPTDLPAVVPPSGLSIERQWYLHNQIGG